MKLNWIVLALNDMIEMLDMPSRNNKERKSARQTFRCTPSRAKQIKDSDFTIDEMLDLFFLFSEDEHFEKLMRLRELKNELKYKNQALSDAQFRVGKLEDDILTIEVEIERIQETIDDGNYGLKEYAKAKRINNSIQTTLKYYSKYYNPSNNPNLSIDDFIMSSNTRPYVKSQATRCGLEFDEFVEQLVKAYNESGVQQVLV